MRRLSRAAAFGTIAAAEPTTGGQSMPSTVTDGRAHSMSDTVAVTEQLHAVQQSRVAAELLGRVGLALPGSRVVQPLDGGVAGRVAQAGQHRDQGGERVRCGSAEHAGVQLRGQRLDRDDDVDHAAQADGRGRLPDGGVPGVAHQDGVRAEQVGVIDDEGLQTTGALLLGTLDDELEVDGDVVAECAEGRRGA